MATGKASRVNRKYKTKYRIRNWREYERGLSSPDHTIAPEPNRCGVAPDPIPRQPDLPDRRFHGGS